MTVITAIPDIDEQGEGKRVLTDYQVHTISIVGKGALGMNLTKVKSESTNDFLQTEKGAKLMKKVEKAKALDKKAEDVVVTDEAIVEAEPEVVVEPEVITEEVVEEVVEPIEEKVKVVEAEVVVEEPVVKAKAEEAVVDAVVADVVEETAEAVVEAPVVEDEVAVVETVVEPEVIAEVEVVVETEGEVVADKAKSFTSSEMISAQTDILKGVHALVEKIHKAIPDANLWEITDMVYNSIWKVEDAIWSAENSEWNDIYDEVHAEVNTRVTKAKALKVVASGSLESKLKALEAVDPELAKLMTAQLVESKAKALAAEDNAKAVIRAKSLKEGAEQFKRIATEDNSTDQIVDALSTLEVENSAVHSVIAKALATASSITMGGALFGDVGSSETVEVEDMGTYVDTKAKALVDTNGGEIAAARATVRQSEEFKVLFG